MPFEGIIAERYPKTVSLADGKELVVRPLLEADQPGLLDFFKRLPATDRLEIGLDKLDAEFIAEQTAAIESFQKLGFVKVCTLPQHALDLHGGLHDLVLMVYELKDEEYYAGD